MNADGVHGIWGYARGYQRCYYVGCVSGVREGEVPDGLAEERHWADFFKNALGIEAR